MFKASDEQTEGLKGLCRRYHVRRLDLFGSAVTGEYDPERSDLDFVVEFLPSARHAYADTYFSLLEGLEKLFGMPVDLVVGAAIINPYFRDEVEETSTPFYEA